jgi:hypothetical protein
MYLSSASLAVFLFLFIAASADGQPGLRGGGRAAMLVEDDQTPIEANNLVLSGDQRSLKRDPASILPPIEASPQIEGILYDGEEGKEEPSSMSLNSYYTRSTTTGPTLPTFDVDTTEKRTEQSDGKNTKVLDEEPMDPSDFLGWTGGVDETNKKKQPNGIQAKRKKGSKKEDRTLQSTVMIHWKERIFCSRAM